MRFRSSGTDTDVGQVFTSNADYTSLQSVTIRIALTDAAGNALSLASNPTFQFEFFSFSGSGDPTPSVNSSATKDAVTNYTYNRLWSLSGPLSPSDFASIANSGFITFDVASQNQGLVNGNKYGFTVGFASETANSNNRIRVHADSSGLYSDGSKYVVTTNLASLARPVIFFKSRTQELAATLPSVSPRSRNPAPTLR